uniref:Putative ovule protein n=1 Tax=Solanum chacoense TaxID=4108 RepID=A0A0V0GVP3_SOLCH
MLSHQRLSITYKKVLLLIKESQVKTSMLTPKHVSINKLPTVDNLITSIVCIHISQLQFGTT